MNDDPTTADRPDWALGQPSTLVGAAPLAGGAPAPVAAPAPGDASPVEPTPDAPRLGEAVAPEPAPDVPLIDPADLVPPARPWMTLDDDQCAEALARLGIPITVGVPAHQQLAAIIASGGAAVLERLIGVQLAPGEVPVMPDLPPQNVPTAMPAGHPLMMPTDVLTDLAAQAQPVEPAPEHPSAADPLVPGGFELVRPADLHVGHVVLFEAGPQELVAEHDGVFVTKDTIVRSFEHLPYVPVQVQA